ncbi:hypothetical protein DENSPDRAFT_862064 [Dentipellis sp. KUC8613]|nr:hypothetical protein DENSPDRAFT_862064 [Dentipellis sp. KUC8613]
MAPRKRKRLVAPIQLSDESDNDGASGSRHVSIKVPMRKRPKVHTKVIKASELTSTEPTAAPDAPPDIVAGEDGAPAAEEWLDENTVYINESDTIRTRRRLKCTVPRKPKKRRVKFITQRNIILDEMLRHEGLGDQKFPTQCGTCGSESADTSCRNCIWPQLQCRSCRWNGTCFVPYSLYNAGLVIQLGHDGAPCPNPHDSTKDITVIDVSGIHRVRARFCSCLLTETARTYVQLLRAKWWPMSLDRPQTTVTFRTLQLFHSLSLQAKINSYDFYHSLIRVTNGTGLRQPKNRYAEFSRAVRCFRNVRMAKRGGRGHDPGGMEKTEVGSMAIECPACPQPGRNLPQGWEDAPSHLKFLYALLLAVDANFKLKLESRNYVDVELAPGWAYFVPEVLYQSHLATYEDEAELKTCDSTFAAVDHANMPGSKRFSVNGVGAVVCARHAFFWPNGAGDLKYGERYGSMGFMLLMTIMMTGIIWKLIIISYDIACQFSKNFTKRMDNFPAPFRLDTVKTSVKFLIPKFHLPAHGSQCHTTFSFNLEEGVRRTYGEGIEANWSRTNGVTLATREMSPGNRHEAINDVFGYINWEKTLALGSQLASSLKTAVAALTDQAPKFRELRNTFPEDVTSRWDEMIVAWDKDKSKPNPYEEPVHETSLADVRLELSEEEAQERAQGAVSLHEMTASTFLSVGIELQDQQRALRSKDKEYDSRTTKKKLNIQERRNALQHRIKAWRTVQAIYMPVVASLLSPQEDDQSTGPEESRPEFEKLWLPSEVDRAHHTVGLIPRLAEKELRLRLSEAEDALHELRRLIRIHLGLRHYKKAHVNGPSQKRNTRARQILTQFMSRIAPFLVTFLASFRATYLVDPSGDDEDADDRTAAQRRRKALGEGRKEIPWIWRTVEKHSMRVTYAKSRARVRRWEEEIQLLTEEMRRVLMFFGWKSQWWASLANARPDAAADIKSGLQGYAVRQSQMYVDLARAFRTQWVPVLRNLGLTYELPGVITHNFSGLIGGQNEVISLSGGGISDSEESSESEDSITSEDSDIDWEDI